MQACCFEITLRKLLIVQQADGASAGSLLITFVELNEKKPCFAKISSPATPASDFFGVNWLIVSYVSGPVGFLVQKIVFVVFFRWFRKIKICTFSKTSRFATISQTTRPAIPGRT